MYMCLYVNIYIYIYLYIYKHEPSQYLLLSRLSIIYIVYNCESICFIHIYIYMYMCMIVFSKDFMVFQLMSSINIQTFVFT